MDIRQGARAGMLALAVCVLAACGGGGGGDEGGAAAPPAGGGGTPTTPEPPAPYPDIPATDVDAARFLTQATFGPTATEIARVRQIGYKRWIDEQIAATPTLVLPHMQQLVTNGVVTPTPQHRRNYWLWQAATANDQLRMRMALRAERDLRGVRPRGRRSNATVSRIADYQDTLSRGAFGNYRQLLEDVTLHPAMGYYLSHVGNQQGRPAPQHHAPTRTTRAR